jgi:hypothetical protein
MAMWFRKKATAAAPPPADPEAAPAPPGEPAAQRPHLFVTSGSWLDEIVAEHQQQGDFDDLPGSGRPLKLDPSFDLASHLLKNASVLPPWLELQKEIRQDLRRLTAMPDPSPQDFEAVNAKIARFNRSCPVPSMQRSAVRPETVAEQLPRWD